MGQLVAQEASAVCACRSVLSTSPSPPPGHRRQRSGYRLRAWALRSAAHGTTAALALLNDAVKKGGVMASSHVGGLSGAFIPVSEDAGMIAAAKKSGALSIRKA